VRPPLRLIVNSLATGVRSGLVEAVREALDPVAELQVIGTEHAGHARELAAAASDGIVVGLGGDGTANEVANGVRPGVVMAALPAGASSVFARQLGYPRATVPAARVLAAAIAAGSVRTLGLGVVDGRRFTFAAGYGLDAEMMRRVDEARRLDPAHERPGDLAVARTALRVLAESRFALPARMTVRAGGSELRASYVAVANQHPYTYFGRLPVRTAPRAGFGHALDAVAVGQLRSRDLWRLAVYGLVWPRHASGRDARVQYLHDVAALEVACDEPVALQVDGEYLGRVERVAVRYRPAAVRVLIPPSAVASFPAPAQGAEGT
jgi:diacylglycerol kinase family enzyme